MNAQLRRSSFIWHGLRRNPGSVVGLVIIMVYLVMAVLGPSMFPNARQGDPAESYAPPSGSHIFGTDHIGRDIFELIVIGTRPVMEVAILTAVLIVVVGCSVGLAAGYFRGWTDTVLMRITDTVIILPGFPLLILIAAFFPLSNSFMIAAVLAVTSWGGLARAIRSQVLSLREREYLEAARSLRLSGGYIVLREVTPNLMPYIVMNLMLGVTGAIYAQVGLFFLGVLPIRSENWGVMLNLAYSQTGAIYSVASIGYVLAPVLAILVLQLGAVLLLRFLDEIFNPRLRAA
ncbi:ABC transporter permease [Microbacterium sp. BWT-B31]|uniref:ABC transporter permease n=1 Tax=Microbacterium sp. BWT-B31 TaxID=3232072 RepID=UPI003527E201